MHDIYTSSSRCTGSALTTFFDFHDRDSDRDRDSDGDDAILEYPIWWLSSISSMRRKVLRPHSVKSSPLSKGNAAASSSQVDCHLPTLKHLYQFSVFHFM